MTQETTPLGKITVSKRAIASVASHAALRSYGIVGMGSRSLPEGWVQAFARDPRHGVAIQTVGDNIVIDLYVVIEYGTRVSSVAASVANTVRYLVEKTLGMPIAGINIHVQDLHISDVD